MIVVADTDSFTSVAAVAGGAVGGGAPVSAAVAADCTAASEATRSVAGTGSTPTDVVAASRETRDCQPASDDATTDTGLQLHRVATATEKALTMTDGAAAVLLVTGQLL